MPTRDSIYQRNWENWGALGAKEVKSPVALNTW